MNYSASARPAPPLRRFHVPTGSLAAVAGGDRARRERREGMLRRS